MDEMIDENSEPFFSKAYHIVTADRHISPIESQLYCYLKGRCFGSRNATFPSQQQMIDDIGFKERCIRDSLKALEKRGLIEIRPCYSGHRRVNNRYILKDLRGVYGEATFMNWDKLSIYNPQASRETVKKIIALTEALEDDAKARALLKLSAADKLKLKPGKRKEIAALEKKKLTAKQRSAVEKSLATLREQEQEERQAVQARAQDREMKRLQAKLKEYSQKPTGTSVPTLTGTSVPVITGTGMPVYNKTNSEEEEVGEEEVLELPEKQADSHTGNNSSKEEDKTLRSDSSSLDSESRGAKSQHEIMMAFADSSSPRVRRDTSKGKKKKDSGESVEEMLETIEVLRERPKHAQISQEDWEHKQAIKILTLFYTAMMLKHFKISVKAGVTTQTKAQWKQAYFKRFSSLSEALDTLEYTFTHWKQLSRKKRLSGLPEERLFFSGYADFFMLEALSSSRVSETRPGGKKVVFAPEELLKTRRKFSFEK